MVSKMFEAHPKSYVEPQRQPGKERPFQESSSLPEQALTNPLQGGADMVFDRFNG